MTSILLNDYVEQVDKLIDNDRLVEAIEHCRHILHSYPRHIDTYRIMGKALLEKKAYDDATDLFLRILGADPNDFISHVGLSIIYKEANQNDQALWHLERAYEIQPYNVAIQGELRNLYAVQTESRPGIIPLTRGALARLYMQGELYQQAIAELRRVLAEEPSRTDLQVLLAEALWRDDQRIDAEEVCLSILEELPNCIVVNAILAEIWLQTGRIPEAQKYLHRLQGLTQNTQKSLDKESIPGQAFTLDNTFSLPEETSLEFLQTGAVIPEKSEKPAEEWAESVSFDRVTEDDDTLDQIVLEPESGMHSYDWLADIEELEAESREETAVSDEASSEGDWFSQDKAKEALNLSTGELNAEWLADLRGEEDESSFKPMKLEGAVDEIAKEDFGETDWFADGDKISDEEIATAAGETTASPSEEETAEDWLDLLAENESTLQIDATNLMSDKLLDWAEVESNEEADEEEAHVVKEPKTPLWLSEMSDQELEVVQLNPEEALDWANEPEAELENSDISEEVDAIMPVEPELETGPTSILSPEDQADLPESGELDADDWLADLTEGSIDEEISWTGELADENVASEMQIETSTDELAALGESDDWLQSAAADLDAILETAEFEEEAFPNLAIPELEGEDITDIPDWLNNDEYEMSEELEAAVSSENDPQETPQPEKPEIEPSEAQEDSGLDALDWLDDLTSEPSTDSETPAEPPIETEGMPSWLADANEADTAVEVVDEWESASAEIPDWLQEPIELADLEDNEIIETKEEDATSSLTGLLSEMDVSEEALGLDQMDSLLADWSADEDTEGGELTDLLSGFEFEEDTAEVLPEEVEAIPDTVETVSDAEEAGLTGLLSNLTFDEGETAVSDDDSTFDLPTELDEPVKAEPAAMANDLDNEELSLTELLSKVTPEEETASLQDEVDESDDWLADLTDLTEEDSKPAADDAEEEIGLTGMLANLWPDDETADSSTDLEDALQETKSSSVDELGLTELLAGIDYEEGAVHSDPIFPELDDEPVEPSFSELFAEIEDEPEKEAEAQPISAEDTTWLNQLEADTGSLQDQEDTFDLAEESGLDWLTTPDEPLTEEEITEPELITEAETAEPTEPDGTEEDWDDAMSWLEELAAQQDEPVEELPSVAETMLDEELDTAAKLAATAPMDEESLDWLDELTSSVDDDAALDTLEEVLDEESKPDLPETRMMAEEEPVSDLSDSAEEDEISWLDELATDNLDMSAVEELETVPELEEAAAEPELEENTWLDELTAENTAVVDETVIQEDEKEAVAEEMLDAAEVALPTDVLTEMSDIDSEDLDESWLDAIKEDAPADEPETPEPAEELEMDKEGAETEPHVVVAGVTDALKMDSGIEEAEADLEEALAWLDELDEGVELDVLAEVPETLVDLPAVESEDEEPEAEDVPETIIITPEPDELTLALERLEQHILAEGVDVPHTAVIPLTLSPEELSAALDWIEEAETEAVVEEVDEETAVSSQIEPDLEELTDDPEMWLEQMLSDESDIDIDIAPPPIKPSEDALFVTSDAQEDVPDRDNPTMAVDQEMVTDALLDDVELEGLPEDPDAAVAWLDQMASDDEADQGNLDALIEPDAGVLEDSSDTLPDLELDDPEAWLEQMLNDEMALDVDMQPPPIKPSEDAVYVTSDTDEADIEPETETRSTAVDIAEPVVELEKEDESSLAIDDLADDPEAMLAQLLSDDFDIDVEMEPPAIKPSEDAVYVTDRKESDSEKVDAESPAAVEADLPEPSMNVKTVEDDIIAEVPDDPDEAMVWLEQLAAQQGAAMEELPSVTDAEAKPVLPSWIAQDEESEETADSSTELPAIPAPDEDITSELPDWLDADDEESPIVGETDWLQSLPEVDMETWLSAEEEATVAGPVDEIVIPDTGPLSAPPQTPSTGELNDELFEPVMEPSTGAYNVDEAQLTVAQDALANGRLDEAISQFKQLVTAGSGMMTIISELEQAAETNPKKPAFYQVLGDAYMRNGQLQKALTSYRSALDQM